MNQLLAFIDRVNVPGRWMHGFLFDQVAQNSEQRVTGNVSMHPISQRLGKQSLFCRKMIHGCSLGFGFAGAKLMLFCHVFMMLPGVECKVLCVLLTYLLGLVLGGILTMIIQFSAQKDCVHPQSF